jgi:hypothetical protein
MDEQRGVAPIEELDKALHRTLWDVLWQEEQDELAEFETVEQSVIAKMQQELTIFDPAKERRMGPKADSAIDLVVAGASVNDMSPSVARATQLSRNVEHSEEVTQLHKHTNEQLHDNEDETDRQDESRSKANPLFEDSTFVNQSFECLRVDV